MASRRQNQTTRRQTTFHFVNAHPSSERERSQTRHLVRSHIGKWTWRQIKGAPSEVSDEKDEKDSDEERSIRTDLSQPPPSPEVFGSSYVDPFETYATTPFPSDFVNRCNAYFIHSLLLWNPSNLISSSRLSLSFHDPTLLAAFLFGASSHRHVMSLLNGGTVSAQDRRMVQLSELQSIQMINHALQDPAKATSDAVILSVVCMANNTADESAVLHARTSPFNAPLRSLQSLDVYGGICANPVHQEGLVRLVAMRGGLQNLQLEGLAAIISYADIIMSSRRLTRPHFPFISLTGISNPTLPGAFGFGLPDLERSLGRYGGFGFTIEMAEVFHAMKEYTALIRAYEEGSILDPDMALISGLRNLLQYHILALPARSERGSIFQECHPGYEACRLAALIYGIGVIFPLPAHVAPLASLARQLRLELAAQRICDCDWDVTSVGCVEMFMWILTLGGIAATMGRQSERRWFATELGRVALRRGLSSWYDLKGILQRVLWLDCACDAAGRRLWDESEAAEADGAC
ncbi:hypothetical protein VTN77DRAFT_966 [Rasamsonia byssochlamydoides]|uniref:uncharacterized protein n=1 Tax=Rasamsonia byssochlamydoides TaxID=89139 RepID=UPI0037426ADA